MDIADSIPLFARPVNRHDRVKVVISDCCKGPLLGKDGNPVRFLYARQAARLVKEGRAVYLKPDRSVVKFLGLHVTALELTHFGAQAHGIAAQETEGYNASDGPIHPFGALCESRYAAERRQRENDAIGCHSEAEWVHLLERYQFKCLRCGISAQDTRYGHLTKDHVIPLAKGGTDYISNIQPLCGRCNSWKHVKECDFR
jgi:HNH endonuclease